MQSSVSIFWGEVLSVCTVTLVDLMHMVCNDSKAQERSGSHVHLKIHSPRLSVCHVPSLPSIALSGAEEGPLCPFHCPHYVLCTMRSANYEPTGIRSNCAVSVLPDGVLYGGVPIRGRGVPLPPRMPQSDPCAAGVQVRAPLHSPPPSPGRGSVSR